MTSDDSVSAVPESLGDGERAGTSKRRFRFTIKLILFSAVVYLFVIPLIPGFRAALEEIQQVRPSLLMLGLGLEIGALWCYAPLTKAALGDAGRGIGLDVLDTEDGVEALGFTQRTSTRLTALGNRRGLGCAALAAQQKSVRG